MTNMRLGFLVVATMVASAAFPRMVHAQRSGVEIWAATCGNCHLTQPASRYTAKDWDSIGMHMVITARLTDAQGDAVIEFLKNGAMRPEGSGDRDADPTVSPARAQRSGQVVLTPEQMAAAEKYIRQLKVLK